MKKIMFNDKYGLTKAVKDGYKTMTRRILPLSLDDEKKLDNAKEWIVTETLILQKYARYNIGDIVAISQSYKDIGFPSDTIQRGRCVRKGSHDNDWDESMIGKDGDWYIDQLAGWNNKMFVYAELMPTRIQITGRRIERLQDISDEDCLLEGLQWDGKANQFYVRKLSNSVYSREWLGYTAKDAFATLIDKVCVKGTWNLNPYVVVYDHWSFD